MISLSQLEYIVAVDTYGQFSIAANKCFITQPTLSMQIKKLEKDLGIELFNRSQQPIQATESGKKIIEQARIVLRERDRIEVLVNEVKGKVSGSLKIGIIPSLAPYLLPRFIGSVADKYQNLKIQIQELLTDDLIDALKKDTLDLGIIVTPAHDPNIVEHPVFYEGIYVYANAKHDLLRKKNIDIKEINRPDMWLMSEGNCFRYQVINLCNYLGNNNLPISYESGSLETIRKLIDKEGGFTLLPELAIDAVDAEKGSLDQVRYFKGILPLREVSIVHATSFPKTSAVDMLKNEIKEHIPEALLDKNRGKIVEWK